MLEQQLAANLNQSTLTKETLEDIVNGTHAAGYIFIDASKADKKIYNRIKAKLSAIPRLKIFSGSDSLKSTKDGTFNTYAKRFREACHQKDPIALYELNIFLDPLCRFNADRIAKALKDYKVKNVRATNDSIAHSPTIVFLTKVEPELIISKFKIPLAPVRLYCIDQKSDLFDIGRGQLTMLHTHRVIKKRFTDTLEKAANEDKSNEVIADELLQIISNARDIISEETGSIPSEPIKPFLGIKKHGDPVTFLRVHYGDWLGEWGTLTQKALKSLDRSLFDSVLGKTRLKNSSLEMADIFPPGTAATHKSSRRRTENLTKTTLRHSKNSRHKL